MLTKYSCSLTAPIKLQNQKCQVLSLAFLIITYLERFFNNGLSGGAGVAQSELPTCPL